MVDCRHRQEPAVQLFKLRVTARTSGAWRNIDMATTTFKRLGSSTQNGCICLIACGFRPQTAFSVVVLACAMACGGSAPPGTVATPAPTPVSPLPSPSLSTVASAPTTPTVAPPATSAPPPSSTSLPPPPSTQCPKLSKINFAGGTVQAFGSHGHHCRMDKGDLLLTVEDREGDYAMCCVNVPVPIDLKGHPDIWADVQAESVNRKRK